MLAPRILALVAPVALVLALTACSAPGQAAPETIYTAPGATVNATTGYVNRVELLVAYYGSSLHGDEMDRLRAERDAARAAGDTSRAAALEAQGARSQDLAHRRLAGRARLDSIAEHIAPILEPIAEAHDVGRIDAVSTVPPDGLDLTTPVTEALDRTE